MLRYGVERHHLEHSPEVLECTTRSFVLYIIGDDEIDLCRFVRDVLIFKVFRSYYGSGVPGAKWGVDPEVDFIISAASS